MFDEAALIIMAGIETGIVEADTKWYKIPRTEIRPRPFKSFKGRTIMVTISRARSRSRPTSVLKRFAFHRATGATRSPRSRTIVRRFRSCTV